ncbi:hypothetical protein [Streptacidiphilus sp. EB129]|uniref:hypothetical protein n=1 Tax=Streptacidiphilus sp. EB129 TaxID=3156262 RepID=UPI003516D6A6
MTMPQFSQPAPATPAPKKSKAKGCAGIGCLGVIAVIVIIGVASAMSNKNTPTSSSAAPVIAGAPTSGAAAPAPAAAAPKTLLTLKGTGIKNTAQFTTGSAWTVAYTFDCTAFGSQGNFVVSDETGMPLVNELKAKGSGSSPQYTGGTHHLEINSECDWTLNVTG